MKQLCGTRDVLCIEGPGQGKSLALDCSMASQVEGLSRCIADDLGLDEIDVAGVSFGGRLGLALSRTGLVRRLHVTGVGIRREEDALQRIEDWKGMLRVEGGLEAFSGGLISASYSKAFLEKNKPCLPKWQNFIVEQNTREGLERLISQSHASSDDDIYGVRNSLRSCSSESVRFLLGGEDVVVAKDIAGAMDELLEAEREVEVEAEGKIVGGCGHVLNMEWSIGWRKDVEKYLE